MNNKSRGQIWLKSRNNRNTVHTLNETTKHTLRGGAHTPTQFLFKNLHYTFVNNAHLAFNLAWINVQAQLTLLCCREANTRSQLLTDVSLTSKRLMNFCFYFTLSCIWNEALEHPHTMTLTKTNSCCFTSVVRIWNCVFQRWLQNYAVWTEMD